MPAQRRASDLDDDDAPPEPRFLPARRTPLSAERALPAQSANCLRKASTRSWVVVVVVVMVVGGVVAVVMAVLVVAAVAAAVVVVVGRGGGG